MKDPVLYRLLSGAQIDCLPPNLLVIQLTSIALSSCKAIFGKSRGRKWVPLNLLERCNELLGLSDGLVLI